MPSPPTLAYAGPNGLIPSRDPHEAYTDAVRLAPGAYAQGQVLGEYARGTPASEAQTITVSGGPTGGSATFAFNGGLFVVPQGATAAQVQAAVQALPDVGANNAVVTGSAGGPYLVTFAGDLANLPQALIALAANNLTGGTSPTAAVARTTPGVAAGVLYGPYTPGATDGTQTPRGLLKYPTTAFPNGTHTSPGTPPGAVAAAPTCTAYFTGTFWANKLVGLDAAAVSALGRLLAGAAGNLADPAAELRLA